MQISSKNYLSLVSIFINSKLKNRAIITTFIGAVISYNYHFAISSFRHFALSPFRVPTHVTKIGNGERETGNREPGTGVQR